MTEKTKQKEVKLLQPKIDIVFQSLFNAKNKEITKSFVEALLEEKIDSMIINNEGEITRDYYFIGQGFIQNKYIEATNILKHEE